jgi:hypothetical protein
MTADAAPCDVVYAYTVALFEPDDARPDLGDYARRFVTADNVSVHFGGVFGGRVSTVYRPQVTATDRRRHHLQHHLSGAGARDGEVP